MIYTYNFFQFLDLTCLTIFGALYMLNILYVKLNQLLNLFFTNIV